MRLQADVNQLLTMLAAILVAVAGHEAAHGWAALRMGDPTARLAGRLTLNPIRHLDLVGSVLLPLALKLSGSPFVFGYAKPVPVNPRLFRDYRMGTLVVSAAGVTFNALMCALSGLLFRACVALGPTVYGTWAKPLVIDALLLFGYSAVINAVLAVFNLIPVPPLDGSRILALLLPDALRASYLRLERIGLLLVLVLLLTGAIDRLFALVILPILRLAIGLEGLAFLFSG